MLNNIPRPSRPWVAYLIPVIIAAAGTAPYGFEFARFLEPYSQHAFYALGILLASSAMFANAALGVYSLMNMKRALQEANPFLLLITSQLSAIPIGFMCFYAFHTFLPFIVNVVVSLFVTFVNAAINLSAVANFLKEIRLKPPHHLPRTEFVVCILGYMIGFLVSLSACMASIDGLTHVFQTLIQNPDTRFHIACAIGILTWLPIAALFSNSTQLTARKLYHSLVYPAHLQDSAERYTLLIFFIALFSGSAFAQISIVFFNPAMNIPAIFKLPLMQAIIYSIVIPMAYIASTSVNFIALRNALHLFYKRN